MKRTQSGFTLVEVVVILPVMIVAIAVTITFMVNLMLQISAKNANIALQLEAQSALFAIRDEIQFANFFEGTIQPNETDANQPAGGWDSTADLTNKKLILSEVAYTANRQNINRSIVRIADAPNPCTASDLSGNQFATNTLIYFRNVTTKKLFRRVIVPDQSQNCSTTYRKQTCPTAAPSCPADLLLAENVKDFDITFYSGKSGSADVEVSPATLSGTGKSRFIKVTRADLTLTLERTISGEPTTATAKISLKKAE